MKLPEELMPHPHALEDAVETMLVHGYAIIPRALGERAVQHLAKEASELKVSRPDQADRGNGRHAVVRPRPRTFGERRLYNPNQGQGIVSLGDYMSTWISVFGFEKRLEPLMNWQFNHAVINDMHPTNTDGIMHPHRDPIRFSGLLAIVSCAPATVTIDNEAHPVGTGDLEVFIGADLAAQAGVEQPLHSVQTDQDRISIVYTHDTAPPQTLWSIVRNRLINR